MKRMKKLFAMLVVLTMVLGMTVTASAAEEPKDAVIIVKGLNANAETEVKLYQIVKLSDTKNSWEVDSWAASYVNQGANPYVFDWAELTTLVKESDTILPDATKTAAVDETVVTFDDLEEGAYLVVATDLIDDTSDEVVVAAEYNPMGEMTYKYDEETNLITRENEDKVIWAKYDDYSVLKELTISEDGNNFVHRGEEVTFDITTTFPAFALTATERSFSITDTPSGLQITNIAVKVGGNVVNAANYTVSPALPAAKDTAVTIAFNSDFIGTTNVHAGESVVVTVNAIVTSENGYENTASASHTNKTSKVAGFTGEVEITKVDADDNVLTGAEFQIKQQNADGTYSAPLLFVKQTNKGTDKDYYKVALNGEAGATTTLVATTGILFIEGLEEGLYDTQETLAPAGYRLLADEGDDDIEDFEVVANETANVTVAPFSVTNTKLIALPSTGGIGTTIFTVAGCGIMLAAAYFFFMNRRKEEA